MDAGDNQYRKKLLKLKELHKRSRERKVASTDSLAADAYRHGHYLYENEQVEEAAALFQKLVLQYPTWEELWLALGVSEYRLRRFDRAYTCLSVCWMMQMDNPLPLFHLALVCLQTDRLREGRGLLQQVVMIAGRNPQYFGIEERAAGHLERLNHG